LVRLSPEKQLSRLLARQAGSLNEQEGRARLAAQMPIEEKLRRVPRAVVLDNEGSREELAANVDALAGRLMQMTTVMNRRNVLLGGGAVLSGLAFFIYSRLF